MHFELLPAFASSPQVAAILACICMSPLAPPASMQQCVREGERIVCSAAVYAYLAFMPQIGRHVYGQGFTWSVVKRGGGGVSGHQQHDRRTWRVTTVRAAFLSIKLLDISLQARIVYAYVYVIYTYTCTFHFFLLQISRDFSLSFLYSSPPLCMRLSSQLWVMRVFVSP